MAEIIETARLRLHEPMATRVRAMPIAGHMRSSQSGGDRLNARIHAAINAAVRHPVLCHAYAGLNARVQSLRFRTNQNAAKWRRAVQEHDTLVQVLKARDAVALRAVRTTHLHHKRDTVLDLLRAGEIYPQSATN